MTIVLSVNENRASKRKREGITILWRIAGRIGGIVFMEMGFSLEMKVYECDDGIGYRLLDLWLSFVDVRGLVIESVSSIRFLLSVLTLTH
ncbi:hypothetical protein Tco_0455233 [Tanacetum coccineum]